MPDSPFVGPTYFLASKPASVQRTVNMMPVPLEAGNERVGWVFKDVPGLVEVLQAIPPIYYTSWPYAVFVDEALNAGLSIPQAGQLWIPPIEMMNADLSTPQSGTLVSTLNQYLLWPVEAVNADLSRPQSGALDVVLNFYGNWPVESINADLSTPQSGTLLVQLVTYTNWPADRFSADLSIPLSGTCA